MIYWSQTNFISAFLPTNWPTRVLCLEIRRLCTQAHINDTNLYQKLVPLFCLVGLHHKGAFQRDMHASKKACFLYTGCKCNKIAWTMLTHRQKTQTLVQFEKITYLTFSLGLICLSLLKGSWNSSHSNPLFKRLELYNGIFHFSAVFLNIGFVTYIM